MKYETPKLTALTPAINAVQGSVLAKQSPPYMTDSVTRVDNESIFGYADWEE
jgi:hypothetical protein